MRVLVATLVLMSCAGSAAAQSALAPLPPLPPIGLPLPEITAPLAPVGLPPATTGFERPPVTRRPGGGSPHKPRRPHRFPTVVYLVDSYYWPGMEGARSATPGFVAGDPKSTEAAVVNGVLRLDVEPDGPALQIYVDGSFVGTAEDHAGALTLPAGRHKIELRARGYEPLTFEANVAGGRAITYSGALDPVPPDPAAAASTAADPPRSEPSAAPSTFYYIPGCYMGNVPPTDVVLPPNCDRSKLITRTP